MAGRDDVPHLYGAADALAALAPPRASLLDHAARLDTAHL